MAEGEGSTSEFSRFSQFVAVGAVKLKVLYQYVKCLAVLINIGLYSRPGLFLLSVLSHI